MTQTDELVEKVTRAIAEAEGYNWDVLVESATRGIYGEGDARFKLGIIRDAAKAAIAAIDTSQAAEIARLREALADWLHYATEALSEFDDDDDCSESETLCPKCQVAGCITMKIQLARAALSERKTT